MSAFAKGRWEIIDWGDGKDLSINTPDDEVYCVAQFIPNLSNARLIAEAPVMYDLLNKAFHILGKNAANDGICRKIDECLSRIDGVSVQSEKGKQR